MLYTNNLKTVQSSNCWHVGGNRLLLLTKNALLKIVPKLRAGASPPPLVHNCTIFLCSLDVRNIVQGGDPLYAGFFSTQGSGGYTWPKWVRFFAKNKWPPRTCSAPAWRPGSRDKSWSSPTGCASQLVGWNYPLLVEQGQGALSSEASAWKRFQAKERTVMENRGWGRRHHR